MKKNILFILFYFLICQVFSQTDGFTYQAVILNSTPQELPGKDNVSSSNVLSNKSITVRFSIISEQVETLYQETQQTMTDPYGMIHLTVGQGIPTIGTFEAIHWDGSDKNLKVEINVDGSFKELSNQPLFFIPYEFHRDITATGNLSVDGTFLLGSDLTVDGSTQLNNTLTVEEAVTLRNSLSVTNQSPVDLSGDLTVDGHTQLNNTLTVGDATTLHNSLSVTNQSPVDLSGDLTVDGHTQLNNTLTVGDATTLHNSLSVTNQSPVDLSGDLTVDGHTQLNNTLTVGDATTLHNSLSVTNQSPVDLSGDLTVDGHTQLNNTLTVGDATTLHNSLSVTNQSPVDLSGDLTVDGHTQLNNTLTVEEATTLHNSLSVTNQSPVDLSGDLTVDGHTQLNNTLTVEEATTLHNSLSVTNQSPVDLSGSLLVEGQTTINDILNANGQVTINASGLTGGEENYNAYPLRVEGGDQGIVIKVTNTTPDNSNDFITFLDSNDEARGRIEGQTQGELSNDPEYAYEIAAFIAEAAIAGAAVGLAAIPDPIPDASEIAIASADLAGILANRVAYESFTRTSIGVTYESGAADYAEWLERMENSEKMNPGDIVGVIGGKITKNTETTNHYLVISTNPAMLGNMPETNREAAYEKVAFLGQIPVKVRGKVQIGDFIIPSGFNDGTGKAVSPDAMQAETYDQVVGIAWSSSKNNTLSYINMAIGLNNKDIIPLVIKQQQRIQQLETSLASLDQRISLLEEHLSIPKTEEIPVVDIEAVTTEPTIRTAEIPDFDRAFFEKQLMKSEKIMKSRGIDIEKVPFLKKIYGDEKARKTFIEQIEKEYEVMMEME
ncbi:hypothetical protein HN014_00570 [Aquimarina sp. TRL1]|uniref:hypothetical protein n=1 Tax=Aquimarina sp. (strain TRL1) TaxID=2736252 RepID=UPI00158AF562|nr:hypothetical protein [Aquimarina sp. TRL1]QKX03471.1 hypothetical protein HN014_00570 [Aquimarina sp. TRL1]